MRPKYHPAAAEEAEAAATWYAGERISLGLDFERELSAAVALLAKEPIPSLTLPYVPARLRARRILLHTFPYDLVYVEREGIALIVAVAHHKRRPGYWKARLRA